jgi:hypothetical protein
MKTKIVITNGDLGTDNTLFFTYAIHTWQGMARARYWAEFLAERSGKSVQVFTYYAWREDKTDRPILSVSPRGAN